VCGNSQSRFQPEIGPTDLNDALGEVVYFVIQSKNPFPAWGAGDRASDARGLDIVLIFAKANLRRGTRIKHFMVPPHSLQIISALTPARHRVRIVDEYQRAADPALGRT